jgi:hypothetical protein
MKIIITENQQERLFKLISNNLDDKYKIEHTRLNHWVWYDGYAARMRLVPDGELRVSPIMIEYISSLFGLNEEMLNDFLKYYMSKHNKEFDRVSVLG